jgi:hypothetical protein
MDYYPVEDSLQVLFERFLPLSHTQRRHLREIAMAVLLAGNTHLSHMARWLKHNTQQDSRIQWLRRGLSSAYLRQEVVYQPWLCQALAGYQSPVWHVVIDRSPWEIEKTDIVMLALNYRQRALPLKWVFIPYGSTNHEFQIELLEASRSLIPHHSKVIFHGDGEFGSVAMMRYLRFQDWDFVLGQSGQKMYRPDRNCDWQPLSSLPVTKKQPVYLEQLELTQDHAYGPLNLFAFYEPSFSKKRRKRDIGYHATSLPITPHLRHIGQRRWGIECCFQDYKSSGWQIQQSEICQPQRREGLMTVLSLAYLWASCLGRWLCKTGQRAKIDAHDQRHLSLFRLGWDWLVHRHNMDMTCPTLLTLYQ